MHLVFGMAADNQSYPEAPGLGASVGAAVVGPSGLLEMLATQTGLTRPDVPSLLRVAAWQSKLQRAGVGMPRFWSESLAVDPWSTAWHLLEWRDSLVEAGWTPARAGATVSPRRVKDLADAELSGPDLPPGRADRLREIIWAITRGERVEIALVGLIEEENLLPPGWRHLMSALRSAGIRVHHLDPPPPIGAGTDLATFQRFLRDGHRERLRGDGTVVEIEAGTSLLAAECVAGWIANDPDAGRGTVVLSDGDTALLDQALQRRGLPVLGLSAPSPLRIGFQVIALCFAVVWKPLDVDKLLQLLTLPHSPIASWAAGHLAAALSEEPGIGGAAWARAWVRIDAELREKAEADEARELLEEWRFWLRVGRFERVSGMPTEAAIEICRRLGEWAATAEEVERGRLRRGLVEAARNLRAALAMLGQAAVVGRQMDQMLFQALKDLPDPARCAEEGGIRAVAGPGALWGPADRVVWWRFERGAGRQVSCLWDGAELAALAASGCRPESPAEAAHRDETHWRSVVLHARQALLFVRSEIECGDETARHPFAHQLAPLFATPAERQAIRVPAEQLLARRHARIAGRTVARTAADIVALPEAQAIWELPRTLVARTHGRCESATSLEDMMGCQFRWLLRHVVGLEGGRAKPPDGERLLGNLAHELARAVLDPGIVPDPDSVRARARAEFDGLVERTAAPLLLPGRAAELAHARQRMPDALAALAGFLRSRRMAVEGTEVDCAGDVGGLRLVGRIDVVVRDPVGARAAVDLKWSRSVARRRTELAEGRAIQLATYGHLLGTAERGAASAFFMLRQRLALSTDGSPLAMEEVISFRDLDGTWEAVVADWRALLDLARGGIGLASGVGGEDLARDRSLAGNRDVCASCGLTRLCRIPANRRAA